MNPAIRRDWKPRQAFQLDPQASTQQQPTQRGGIDPTAFISEAGGIGGAVAGAKIGAGLGLFGGPVGAGIGGVLGAGIGGFLGGTGGRLAENKIRDDEFRAGDALKEGAMSGLFGAGPIRLGKLGVGAVRGGTAGASKQLGTSLLAGRGAKLEKAGGNLMASQTNLTRAEMRKLGAPVNQSFSNLQKRTGLTNIDELVTVAKDVTGENGTMTELVRNAIGNTRGVDISDLGRVAERLITDQAPLLTGATRKSVMEQVKNSVVKAYGGSQGSLSTQANPFEVFDTARVFERLAADLRRLPTPTARDTQLAKVYQELAGEITGRLYSAPGVQEGVKQAAPAAASAFRQIAGQSTGRTKKAYNKLADEVLKAENVKEVRSLQRDFVNMLKIDEATQRAAQGAGQAFGGQLTGMGRLVQRPLNAVAVPLDAASGPVGGRLAQAGRRLQTPAGQPSPIGSGVRAGIGASMVGGQPQEMKAQNLESALMGDSVFQQAPMQGQEMGFGQQMGGLEQMLSQQSANPYPRENLLYDLQRDPANAQEYIKQYALLQEIFGEQEQQLTPERAQYLQTTMTSGATVLDDATRALEVLQRGGPLNAAAGTIPSRFGFIRETPAGQLRDLVNSVKANIGIDTLLSIKQSGAGLGQVPQSQLEELQRVLGELDPGMNAKQLERNLTRIQSIYGDIVQNLQSELNQGGGFAPQYAQNIGLEQALTGGMR
jgi:hypothetical protein